MVSLLKKALSLAGVLVVIALVLNLNIGGRPARERAYELWQSEPVQKVYREVSARITAVIRKDISVEDVFKPELPSKQAPQKAEASPGGAKPEDTRTIQLEKLDEADKKALEKILEKSSN
ncbi:MAG TPA: hypothetical protein VJR29_09240 [bacterium]|nr:hypothetical protein [bacterium]